MLLLINEVRMLTILSNNYTQILKNFHNFKVILWSSYS